MSTSGWNRRYALWGLVAGVVVGSAIMLLAPVRVTYYCTEYIMELRQSNCECDDTADCAVLPEDVVMAYGAKVLAGDNATLQLRDTVSEDIIRNSVIGAIVGASVFAGIALAGRRRV